MNLFQIVSELDRNEDIHLARILIMLNEYHRKNRTIDGLTKLAKLDFLLRYPVYLERALQAKGKVAKRIDVKEYERFSVESRMVRYKYGPWDFRYRKFLNLLIAKGLAFYRMEGRTTVIGLTSKGSELSERLVLETTFQELQTRARILCNNFDYSGTYLKDFIYKTFPEIVSLQLSKEI